MRIKNCLAKKDILFAVIFSLATFVHMPVLADTSENNQTYTYDFSQDVARKWVYCVPPAYNISIGNKNEAQAGVVCYTDSKGVTSNVLKAYKHGQRNVTGVINFDVFPKQATDYSVTWKQCNASPSDDYKTGVVLRGKTSKVGTESKGYVQGLMEGYVLLPYNNGRNQSQFRIYKSTMENTNLEMLVNNSIPELIPEKDQPVWYRASVNGMSPVTLKIEYSIDSIDWKIGASYLDNTGLSQSGATQFLWGLAAARTDFYIDNITFSGSADDSIMIPENPTEPVPPAGQLSNEHVDMKFTINGKERSTWVYAPRELPEDRPLFISFHGMNMWHQGMAEAIQFANVADTAQFVVVYPNGDGTLPWDVGGDSELIFVSAIIDKMYDLYQIDKKRVYISGFSWGANFCYRIANRMGDKIAAMVPIMGYPYGPNPNVAECSHSLPILQILGRYDDLFGNSDIYGNVLNKWTKLNGCSSTGKVTNPYPAGSKTSNVKKTMWINSKTGIEVVWMDAPYGHSIPMDKNQISANVEAWNFCKRYNLDGLIDKGTNVISAPQQNTATIVSEEYYTLTGQKVLLGGNHLKGLYILKQQMSDGTKRSCKYMNF